MTVKKQFDKTQLKAGALAKTTHKDYMGHVFRWGFASRFINRTTSVLDVGCGQDQPLVTELSGSKSKIPKMYVGVDLNKIKNPLNRKWVTIIDEFNFLDNYALLDNYEKFNVITNFEVYEHMSAEDGQRLLEGMHHLLADDGKLIFSTPVFCSSYGQANNHIHEPCKNEIEDELHKAGFKIIKQHGTFGNLNDMKKVATKQELELSDELREFFGNEVMGCFLSSKYPEASRNITHICVRTDSKTHADTLECEHKASVVKGACK